MDPVSFSVLCVEDNADTCELIDMWLKYAPDKYNRHFAKTVDVALTLINAQHFDVIVLDSWLDGSSGVELCKTIRITDEKTPIVFFSAVAIEDAAEEALMSGADGYLTKPCLAEAFVATVKHFVINGRDSHTAPVAA